MKWTIRSIDRELRATLLPHSFSGSPDEALAFGRTLDCKGAERLELESEPVATGPAKPAILIPRENGHKPFPLPWGKGQGEGQTSNLVFDLIQLPRRAGWRLTNDHLLAYSMWYAHWRDAISYAAFIARGSLIQVRIIDANSVCRKLVLIVPATCSYTEELRFSK